MIHELKTWPLYFEQVKNGNKTFEVRKDDRWFKDDDELLLREFIPDDEEGAEGRYTGRILHRRISFLLRGGQFGIEEGYVVLGLQTV